MKEFEYVIVKRDLGLTGTGFLKELNELGEEGWEVVTNLDPGPIGFEYILMKREKE